MWWSLGIFFAVAILLFLLVYNGVIGYMPDIDALKNPTDKFASTIYTADGIEMGRYYRSKGNRVYVDYDQMSKYLSEALIATEDVRFEEHSGIDAKAIMRSVIKRIIMQKQSAGGGSTITQQLAKQLYSPESGNIFERAMQKPIEWAIAIKLERFYTKEEIIKMYFNQFDFLNNAVGIKSAAHVYFGKEPKDLNVQESAMLVGMCKNPAYYNPFRHPERVKERRNVVLDQMYKANMLTAEQCDALKKTELGLDPHRVTHDEGIAPYFREELRRMMTAKEPIRSNYSNENAYNADRYAWDNNPLYGWCAKNTKPDGTNYDIYTDGLKIYTTIDSRMQKYAEEAVKEHMNGTNGLQRRFLRERGGTSNPYTSNQQELSSTAKQRLIVRSMKNTERYRSLKAAGMDEEEILNTFNQPVDVKLFSYDGEVERTMTPRDSMLYMKSYLRCGMMSMDPRNGKVKAYVGGPDFKFFKYDMVSTGFRQIGSTVKPYLYALAMENGMTPCTAKYPNVSKDFNGWRPRGGAHGLGAMPTLKSALAVSSNWIPPQMLQDLGPANLVRFMNENFGITSKLDPYLSLSLGANEISLWEMVSGFSAFANYGTRVLPVMVTRICDNRGNVICDFYPKKNQAMNIESAYRMIEMLRAVITNGTGRRISAYGINAADMCGKTGTTNYNADGWFMGFTPELLTGVWVGGEDRYIHFASTAEGQGAAMALPLFGIYMKKVYNDSSLPYNKKAKFNIPSNFEMCGDEREWSRGSGGGGSG
ncbi:MAG: transglycosylase domain-containing protein, partial [Muribaculaceae bacterium]|nr:transglycosylase domain-containing protein [Muribaculaceae bacterium]